MKERNATEDNRGYSGFSGKIRDRETVYFFINFFQEWDGKLSVVVTQNNDSLHQKAGSKMFYWIHGSVLRNYRTRRPMVPMYAM